MNYVKYAYALTGVAWLGVGLIGAVYSHGVEFNPVSSDTTYKCVGRYNRGEDDGGNKIAGVREARTLTLHCCLVNGGKGGGPGAWDPKIHMHVYNKDYGNWKAYKEEQPWRVACAYSQSAQDRADYVRHHKYVSGKPDGVAGDQTGLCLCGKNIGYACGGAQSDSTNGHYSYCHSETFYYGKEGSATQGKYCFEGEQGLNHC